MDRAKRVLWVCSLSTRRTATKGKVKPFPAGPAPCVWPLKAVEDCRLALGWKLVDWVEKHRKFSLRCSFPTYARLRSWDLDFSSWLWAGPRAAEDGAKESSAVISWRGVWESGRRNWRRNRAALEVLLSDDIKLEEALRSIKE